MATASVTESKLLKHKSRKKHFKKQKFKLFRANEPFISIFMWGVNHTIKELSYIRAPLMLMPNDFKAYSKIKIDNHLFNKENLQSHFKVKEYCPAVFRVFRERFGVDDKDYVESLCLQQPIRVEDKGRSRARFLQSYDRKFVIKTLSSEDIAEMHAILPKYHQYIVERRAETLLPQYLGMYRLTLSNTEHYLIVMRNVFGPKLKAHKKYDLKGSTVQREASVKEKTKEFPTFKDNDFVKDNIQLYIDAEERDKFLEKLKLDVEFLASLKLMDYSLLVGIHDRDREDKYMVDQDEEQLDGANDQENSSPAEDENGYLATPPDSPGNALVSRSDSFEEEYNHVCYLKTYTGAPKNEIYFMGLIDILTHYDARKKAAHAVKTAKHGFGADFSVKTPRVFAHRLLQFMSRHIVCGENDLLKATRSLSSESLVMRTVESDLTFLSYHDIIEPSARFTDHERRNNIRSLEVVRFCYSDENLNSLIRGKRSTNQNETL